MTVKVTPFCVDYEVRSRVVRLLVGRISWLASVEVTGRDRLWRL